MATSDAVEIEIRHYASLWSVDVQDDDSVLFGAAVTTDYYGCYEDYFVGRLLPDGAPDASFAAATLEHTVVYDTDAAVRRQGHRRRYREAAGRQGKLQVFRLRPDGSLDPEFGLGGLVVISDGSGRREAGRIR